MVGNGMDFYRLLDVIFYNNRVYNNELYEQCRLKNADKMQKVSDVVKKRLVGKHHE